MSEAMDAPITAESAMPDVVDAEAPAVDAVDAGQETPAATPQSFKIKVDGEEIEISQEEAVRYASMGKAAQKRFQEAAQLRKEAEEIVASYRGNIKEALKDPANLQAFEDAYAAMMEFEGLSDEEKTRRQEKSELERYRDEERRRKEEAEADEFNKLEQRYAADYERQFVTALQSANLPKSPAVVRKMAEYMSRAIDGGVDVSPADVVGYVRDDYVRDIKETLGGLDESTLFNLLGDDVAGKIRKADLSRVKGNQQYGKPVQAAPKPAPAKSGYRSLEEYLEDIS